MEEAEDWRKEKNRQVEVFLFLCPFSCAPIIACRKCVHNASPVVIFPTVGKGDFVPPFITEGKGNDWVFYIKLLELSL